jgi:hypothetical protein
MVNDPSPHVRRNLVGHAWRAVGANRLRAICNTGWILALVLLGSVARARAVAPAMGQTQAARWLGLTPGARWSWSFEGHGVWGPRGRPSTCEFRASVEDRVLASSRRGDVLRVELDRRVADGAGDRCGGLLPVPRSGRVVLLIGGEAFLRDATRNWDPGWSRVKSGIGVHAVPAGARRPLVDESRLLWVMPLRAGVSWLVDPWEDTAAAQPSQLQEVRSVEVAAETVETASGSFRSCFRILTRFSANTEATEWVCEGTGVVRSQERRFAGSLRYETDLQLTRFTRGRGR